MNPQDDPNRLDRIATLWSVVRLAHEDPGQQGRSARETLLSLYSGAVRRYLLGAVRDPDLADELTQEFAYRFLHGGLRGADRERGRFRDFVKGVLFHLVADYHQRKRKLPGQIPSDAPEPGADCTLAAERDEAFRVSWRDELLQRAWTALEASDSASGQSFYTVLRFRSDHQDMSSAEMAQQLSARLGKEINAAAVRKTLERARDRFADLLLYEITQALADPSREALEEELADLGLLEHCRTALDRRRS